MLAVRACLGTMVGVMLSPGARRHRGGASGLRRVIHLVSELVGRVSAERYRELVDVGRELARSLSTSQFPLVGAAPGVGGELHVHRTLASIPSDRKRWAAIADPPPHPRTAARVSTQDAARRVVGQQVDHPVTTAEKVRAIVELARDEQVAVVAVDGLLRRPEVAFKVVVGSVARHIVNQAQIDHATASQTLARARLHTGTRDVVATGRRVAIESAAVVVELVGACAAFAATATRVVPQLAGTNSAWKAVWSALAEACPHGLSTAQLQLVTKLGNAQARRGTLYIREISPPSSTLRVVLARAHAGPHVG